MRLEFLAAAMLISSGTAAACEQDPFLFTLEGETLEQAKKRSSSIRDDLNTVRQYNREKFAYENATTIYLAKVRSYEQIDYMKLPWKVPSTQVEPIVSFKGVLPTGNQRLVDQAQSGACTDYGDGPGAWAKVGEHIVVFVGLPKSDVRPNGVDSVRVNDIRTIPMLDKVRAAGKDVENEL